MKHPRTLIALSSMILIGAAPPPSSPDAKLRAMIAPVSGARMKATVEALVGFGTRHTLSSQSDPKRGIGAALGWSKGQFESFGLPTERPCDTFTGARIPTPTRVCDMVAIQRGTERPNDVVIITGHIDSRVTDILNADALEPGANDDGSGSATVMEAARVLSRHKFAGTIVYALLSGEEQGLYGGKVLAAYAKAQGWNVVANLNNDIVGNSCSSDGVCDATHVRVFSEGPRWQGHEQLAAQWRSLGGENDSPSRNISRWLDGLADRLKIGLDVRQVWRNDRFGRGGDHTEFLNAGYPAVRFSVAIENYDWQHQDVRVENGKHYGDTVDHMNFAYLEKVAKLNIAALAALASAPPPPEVTVEGAVSTDTSVSWRPVAGARGYAVRWRRTDAANWEHSRPANPDSVTPAATPSDSGGPNAPTRAVGHSVVLKGIRVDDWVFGVSSVSKDGFESPVASAVPGGAFQPWVAAAESK
ncbi:MAG: M28 family peptidase [Sphingomicrobium sp.]